VEAAVPLTDAVAGDEGIDDGGFSGRPFKPGRRETFVKAPAEPDRDASQLDVPRPSSEE
jgi:hypothetical protein